MKERKLKNMGNKINNLLESNLIPILKSDFLTADQIIRDLNNKKYFIYNEFKSSYGIADLVFYNFNKEALEKRIKNGVSPILSKVIVKTLILIQGRKKVSLSFLEKLLPYNRQVIKNKIIIYLIQNKFLSKSRKSDFYWVEYDYENCLENLYSVEAKISNWKRGFYQAYRYKWFSNYSFLALHEKFTKPAIRKIFLFEKYNIGLMEVSIRENRLKMLFKPKPEKPYSKEYTALAFEQLFSDYLRNAVSHKE